MATDKAKKNGKIEDLVTPVMQGKHERKSFAKIDKVLEIPDLIEIQKNSYRWFLEQGMDEVLRDVSPITDFSETLSLEFVSFTLDDNAKYPIEECKERDVNYAAPFHVLVRLHNKNTGEITEKQIYMGDFPKMTDNGTFIINGAERVIVSQIVRSPGMYYEREHDKGLDILSATVIPYRGAWLEYEIGQSDGVFYVRIDKNRKLPVTIFLRALGIVNTSDITEMFGESPLLKATLDKDEMQIIAERDKVSAQDAALKEIYRKLRPGEPPLVESAKTLINNLFFDARRYDLAKVGRYKFDKKMSVEERVAGKTVSRDVISPYTGEVLASAGDYVNIQLAREFDRAGVQSVYITLEDGTELPVLSNGTVYPETVLGYSLSNIGIKNKVNAAVLSDIIENNKKKSDIIAACRERIEELVPHHITRDDIFASVNYFICINHNVGRIDDIDHLGNRRLRSVGELLQNQIRIGFTRMDKNIKERMTTQDPDSITPEALINTRPIQTAIREFFGSSPLSQFMDQNNPLAELTHKRRISALGPGGLSRDRASFEVRDVHYTHYGRMCPIETPEGPNIGLISYLASYAKVDEYGFMMSPYRKIDQKKGVVTKEIEYMTADREDHFTIAQANEPLDDKGRFRRNKVTARCRGEIIEVDRSVPEYMDVAPQMVVSVATSMIPFLENDDNSRALMGSNMQKQAVPLMVTDRPIVATGMEYKAAVDSGVVVCAKSDGTVDRVCSDEIIIKTKSGDKEVYPLIKFKRSNQGTCVNQRPIVKLGEKVKAGQVIADGPATSEGEISLGKNALVGFMSWEGYNYEDAVLLNENLVRHDTYTSIHIEEYMQEARETKLGPEEITREVPNVGDDALRNLDENGVVVKGTEVRAGDILVGKVTPKGETEATPEERLLRAIFGEKARDVRDTSLRLPHGESGIVVDVRTFSRENHDELNPGVSKVVRVYIAQKRKISVGDKMAGRHGNKGVVSRILPPEDMPFLPDGTPLDIVLNPMGVPSRMNIGQVLEVHLGIAAKKLGWHVMTPVFDGATMEDIEKLLEASGLEKNGKSIVYDGRTGQPFDNPVTVGIMYYLKLHHLVDDKVHARSTGPYSLVTQQPLGGKAQFGGQRFGEMEVWALEAYGAAYILQEMLTIKSDDVLGRTKAYEAIVKGENIPTPGVPESFKVLVKELQALALDVKVLDRAGDEIDISTFNESEREEKRVVDDRDIGEAEIDDDILEQGFTEKDVDSDDSKFDEDDSVPDFDE